MILRLEICYTKLNNRFEKPMTFLHQFISIVCLASFVLTQSTANAPLWTQISCIPGVNSQNQAVSCSLAVCSQTQCQPSNPIVYSTNYPITLQRQCSNSSSVCTANFCEYATANLVSVCTSKALVTNIDGSETAVASLSGVKITCGFIAGNMSTCSTASLAANSSSSGGLAGAVSIIVVAVASTVYFL